ncbi:multicopper oxidase [Aspergillus alliaceus]|uniref:multicopper oxidase n=1 Tax=Petromyces alliaceus TaxID=209559 RepID=UPI0012A4A1F3|nr:multicopper oxidase [Aspergillus alliaceus]KAB8238972.1 multicopper oxidase [Aspergillus alliaceus]
MKIEHYVIHILRFFGISSLMEPEQYPLHPVDGVTTVNESPEKPPIFPAPGGGSGDNRIKCDYSRMGSDWEHPDSPSERRVWLRNKKTSKEFNISTDYENEWPLGIKRKYHVEILNDTHANWDGVEFHGAKLINGTFPGPWIQITVTNKLSYNGTAIHFHGQRLLNNSLMDGVPGVTQCPIAPGHSFTYRFNATQYGTSWYHSHYSLQYTDGVLGPVTVQGPTSDNWDTSVDPILLGDHIHESAFQRYYQEQFAGLKVKGNHVKGPPKMQSILINGRGGKRYLLRLINTSTDTTYIFTIDNHNFTVIEADLVPVTPYNATYLAIGIGQRYHVVLNTWPKHQRNGTDDFWIRTIPADHCSNFDASAGKYLEVRQGILYYNEKMGWPETTESEKVSYECRDEPYENLKPVLPWKVPKLSLDERGELSTPNSTIRLANWSLPAEPNVPAGPLVNNWNMMDYPIWVAYSKPTVKHLDGPFDKHAVVYEVSDNETSHEKWNYMVIIGNQTTDPGQGKNGRLVPAAHPIHLHGHDFALLQQSNKSYVNSSSLDLKYDNPPRRDVVLLPKNGFIVIAFRTDNPGTWAAHCHIAWHASAGLAFQILETKDRFKDLLKTKPLDVAQLDDGCKAWGEWFNNSQNHWHPGGRFQDDSGI